MIYNLYQYLKNEFPTEKFYINQFGNKFPDEEIPDRAALITETGGIPALRLLGNEPTVQILNRDIDQVKSRSFAWLIYNKLHGRFGLTLPSISVSGELYGELMTSQINALVIPQCIGADDNGLIEWSTNYHIIY
jgi:hypothetical protein